MLTGDLVRVRIQKKAILPAFIKTEDEALRDRAGQLVEVYRQALAEGWTRGQVDEAAGEVEGLETDIRLVRGLAKVLADRASFSVVSPQPPPALRAAVFARAASLGPLRRAGGPLTHRSAEHVLAEVAHELGCTPAQVSQSLYADLKEEQVLGAAELPEPEELLARYNVALVQSILLRADALAVRMAQVDPKRLRQLYRILKFHGLMYRIHQEAEEAVLEVDGPASLLQQATRYGLQLAIFFPAILRIPAPWTLRAEIRWGERRLRKELVLTHEAGLRCFYADPGVWHSRTETWFEERFRELDCGWTISPGEALDLGGQELLVPDFTFRKAGRVAHLDIIGTWRKAYLKKRLQVTPKNVILAVPKRLAAEASAALPEQVLGFAEVLPPKKVLERIEAVARPAPRAVGRTD